MVRWLVMAVWARWLLRRLIASMRSVRSAAECPQVELAVVVADAVGDFGSSFGEAVEVVVDQLLAVGGGVDAFGAEVADVLGEGVELLR